MMKSPAELAQAQLDAYNAKDLDAFCACYSETVRVWHPPEAQARLEGMAAFRRRYAQGPFAEPAVQARVAQRMIQGAQVVDHEIVTGREGGPQELLVLYRCADGLIQDVFFFRQS